MANGIIPCTSPDLTNKYEQMRAEMDALPQSPRMVYHDDPVSANAKQIEVPHLVLDGGIKLSEAAPDQAPGKFGDQFPPVGLSFSIGGHQLFKVGDESRDATQVNADVSSRFEGSTTFTLSVKFKGD